MDVGERIFSDPFISLMLIQTREEKVVFSFLYLFSFDCLHNLPTFDPLDIYQLDSFALILISILITLATLKTSICKPNNLDTYLKTEKNYSMILNAYANNLIKFRPLPAQSDIEDG